MNGFNLSDITDAKLGTTTLGSIYLGSTKLWPLGTDYSKEYLTIESLADNNTITWTFTGSDPIQNVIYWSKNGTSWTSAIASTSDIPVSLATLNKGEKMYLKGENVTYASSASAYSHFNSDYEFNVSGNIMSLIYGDNFIGQITLSSSYNFAGIFRSSKVYDASNLILPATTLTKYCYRNMFNGCTSLATAPVLPATTLTNYCYYSMFYGCTSLATAPVLPATTLANSCYMSMFAGTKITAAPELPATILTDSCYRNMFYGCASLRYPPTLNATILQPRCYQHMFFGCTSLKTAPELPATTLVTYCYAYMFQNCTSLSYIKCLATNISASNSHDWWLYNVASTGKFVKPTSMHAWPASAHGIPSSWTVVNI